MKFLKFLKYLVWQPIKDVLNIGGNATLSRNFLFILGALSLFFKLFGNDSLFSHTLFTLICFLGALAFHIKREWNKWNAGLETYLDRQKAGVLSKSQLNELKLNKENKNATINNN